MRTSQGHGSREAQYTVAAGSVEPVSPPFPSNPQRGPDPETAGLIREVFEITAYALRWLAEVVRGLWFWCALLTLGDETDGKADD